MKKSAFTLIELLVVIAIIAILAAILFPVFAQAKVAAKKTQALSNVKNINTAAQIYLADYDDVWPLWSAGMGCTVADCPPRAGTSDTGSVFDLRYMFPTLIDPYIKNGVNSKNGELKDIWVNPLSDGIRPSKIYNTFAYNHWTLGGFSTCARTINLLTTGVCVTRTTAAYGEYADLSYNYPASSTILASPAETLSFTDGSQLSRPPQYAIASPTGDVRDIAVWGPSDPGNGQAYNVNGSLTIEPLGWRKNLISGNGTTASYADGHAKHVPTGTLYHVLYKADKWKGAATTNKGWSRDWGN
ncbi:MAG: prepilin-type N-terminal cleavage/methylation domain-containing protein [Fimbriimonadaceae bacterium]|nr:MAG: prepilin-type N-terminal cleavage/methylation domain-containing protein [Fimbriimonadaceae bacterium]